MAKYKSPYQKQIDEITNSILNREQFSYNMNADAIYKIYKDQYTTQGQYDMRNVMGDMAGNTGGYASSAAITGGETAYQQNLTELNNKVPELYDKALDKYNAEGNDMYQRYNLLNSLEQFNYTKYRNKVQDSQSDRSYELQKKAYGL